MQPSSPEPARRHPSELLLESLSLSVRARNALKCVGCNTVADVLRLDLGRPVRGLGRLAREELLMKLDRAGFPHPAESQPSTEITRLERNLERMQRRIDSTLAAVSKEIDETRARLRKLRLRPPASSDPLPPPNGAR